ncbi:MAG: cyclopropane fatty acyl phospholipid synthase [Candidatus Staskawiczbacteria bacterium]|nr:cyclopropane fatty acyl phospholipid synthase [Candidatus Staskawiczbacteria bacterium]
MRDRSEQWIKKAIEATGIAINGHNPWDIKVINSNFYRRVKSQLSLGLGESYVDGWWECDRLDDFFYRLLSVDIYGRIGFSLPILLDFIKGKMFNLQTIKRAFKAGEKHYDIGNDIFAAMLGKTMAYSCGYWRNAGNLDEAEEAKLDLICQKLNLQKGQSVLDIGSGWGSFALYAAKKYGVKVLGITVSKEQIELAQKICSGLPVCFRLQDYRCLNLNEKFDHIVSIGMFEHVGLKNYGTFFKIVKKCLDKNGLFLLHTITSSKSGEDADPWITKYIFPGGFIPSLRDISSNAEGLFTIEDGHNFGADYDKTLMAWHENFENAWSGLKNKYGERFYRMWNYYLLLCAGIFRARHAHLWQIIFSPCGVPGGYKSVR